MKSKMLSNYSVVTTKYHAITFDAPERLIEINIFTNEITGENIYVPPKQITLSKKEAESLKDFLNEIFAEEATK